MADKFLTHTAEQVDAAIDDINNHKANTSNPHSVTGSQVVLTGYEKPSSASAIEATDNTNQAIGKLEKGLDGKQNTIDGSNKLDADIVDDSSSTNKFNMQADWSQTITTAGDYIKNKPTLGTAAAAATTDFATSAQGLKADSAVQSISNQQNAIADGGNGYAIINGTRVYVSSTAPTGDIPDGSIGLGF